MARRRVSEREQSESEREFFYRRIIGDQLSAHRPPAPPSPPIPHPSSSVPPATRARPPGSAAPPPEAGPPRPACRAGAAAAPGPRPRRPAAAPRRCCLEKRERLVGLERDASLPPSLLCRRRSSPSHRARKVASRRTWTPALCPRRPRRSSTWAAPRRPVRGWWWRWQAGSRRRHRRCRPPSPSPSPRHSPARRAACGGGHRPPTRRRRTAPCPRPSPRGRPQRRRGLPRTGPHPPTLGMGVERRRRRRHPPSSSWPFCCCSPSP